MTAQEELNESITAVTTAGIDAGTACSSSSEVAVSISVQQQQEEGQSSRPQQQQQQSTSLSTVPVGCGGDNFEQIIADEQHPHHVALSYFTGPKYEEEFAWERDPYAGSPESKYERYELPVAHDEGDRAMQIKLKSFKRPHMRALHCAWISFFLAFTVWFAPAPLLKEIGNTLNLTKQELWNSSITNDVTAIIMRILIGPICDTYGARIPMAIVLVLASIPCSMIGLVNSAAGLCITRFFIGIAGSSFVMSQFWPSRMFSREIAGTANGIVGGWGNLGGAFTQLFMGRILFPLFKNHVYNGNPEPAWRLICIFPASLAFVWGLIVWRISDDAPVGNYSKMRRNGTMDRLYFTTGLKSGARLNTWILYIQYACCFGVELVMNNGAVLYFIDEFGMNTEDASLMAFAYGSMNIVFRGLGGYLSDALNVNYGLRGRLWLQMFLLLFEGAVIIMFSYAGSLPIALATMVIFSVFTQSSEGAIFGVVPYVSKLYMGSVAGFVGSGGNMGSVVYGFIFRSLPYREAFLWMGSLVMVSSILTIWIRVPCHAGMLWGEDNFAVISARARFAARRSRENIELGANRHRGESSNRNIVNINSNNNNSNNTANAELPPVGTSNNSIDNVSGSGDSNGSNVNKTINNNDIELSEIVVMREDEGK